VTTTNTTTSIVAYPDERLRQISEPVEAITPEIIDLAKMMVATMRERQGIGLAAIQIGVPLRVIVVQVDATEAPVAMINPEILARSDGEVTTPEGCLSIPGLTVDVPRAAAIDLRYTDLAGKTHELRLDSMPAICVQHELDHLDGRLIIDRLSRLKRQMYEKKIAKAKR
jgi:peptide deformylase